MFSVENAGVLPMILGTAARVILMTIFVIPIGVITAIYLTEYARAGSLVDPFYSWCGQQSRGRAVDCLRPVRPWIFHRVCRTESGPHFSRGRRTALGQACDSVGFAHARRDDAARRHRRHRGIAGKPFPPGCARRAWLWVPPNWKRFSKSSCRRRCPAS